MITIHLKSGEKVVFNPDDYSEFIVCGWFIKVNLSDMRVRYYNLDFIEYVEVPEGFPPVVFS